MTKGDEAGSAIEGHRLDVHRGDGELEVDDNAGMLCGLPSLRLARASTLALATSLVCCGEVKQGAAASNSGTPAASIASTPSQKSSATVASNMEKKKPPKPRARTRHPAPVLPALEMQEKAAAPHKAEPPASTTEYPCGAVKVDGETIPLECVDPAALAPQNEESRVVVPYALMPPPAETLPKNVDHRDDDMEGPTRNQGAVGSCTAFATTSALDHTYAIWTGKVEPLSVMEVWAKYHAPSEDRADAALMGTTIARETDWPYDPKVAHTWSDPGGGADPGKLLDLGRKGIVLVTQVEHIWRRPKGLKNDAVVLPVDLLRAKLAAGRDLIIGIQVPEHFKPVASKGDTSGAMYVPDDITPRKSGGGHMISLVGYHGEGKGTYFLLKNSWGPKWGENGYAWVHSATLAKFMFSVFDFDAEPVEPSSTRRPVGKNGSVDACAAGQAPDTVTCACKSTCASGGPETNGFCGDTDGCDAGEVNVSGECVLAAPKVTGKDPKSGVSFECAPGGCVYEIPKGFEGCKDKCQKSCPAPDFRLAKGSSGLTCVE